MTATVYLLTPSFAADREDANPHLGVSNTSKSVEALLAESLTCYGRQDYHNALLVLNRCQTSASDKASVQVAILQAMCWQHLGDFAQAAESLVAVLQTQDSPLASKAGLLLASQYFMCGEFDAADTLCAGVIERFSPGRDAATAMHARQTFSALKEKLADAKPAAEDKLGSAARADLIAIFDPRTDVSRLKQDKEAFERLLNQAHERDRKWPWTGRRLCIPAEALDYYLQAFQAAPAAREDSQLVLHVAQLLMSAPQGSPGAPEPENAATLLRYLVATTPPTSYTGMLARVLLADCLYWTNRNSELSQFGLELIVLLYDANDSINALPAPERATIREWQAKSLRTIGAGTISCDIGLYPSLQRTLLQTSRYVAGSSLACELSQWLEILQVRMLEAEYRPELSIGRLRRQVLDMIRQDLGIPEQLSPQE